MRRRIDAVSVVFLVVLLTLWDCTDRRVAPAAFSTRDSAGVVIVENDAPGWPADSGWRLGPSDLEVGDDTTVGPQLASVGWVSVMSDGHIVVTDPGADAVVLYDPAARTGRTIARKGHGPGEVTQVSQAWVTPGDSIVTWDFGNGRIQVFDPDGTLRRSVRLDANRLGPITFPIGRLPEGEFLALRRSAEPPDRPAGRDSATYLHLSGDSLRLLDTVAVLPDYDSYRIQVNVGGQTGGQRQVMLFPHMTHVFTTPTGFLVADNASWQLQEYDGRGTLRRLIRRSIAPRPVPPDDVAAYKQRFEQAYRGDRSIPPDLLAQYIAQIRDAPHPATMPMFGSVARSPGGTYWVQRYDPLGAAPPQFSVIDSSGRYLGDIGLPSGSRLMEVTETYVLVLGRGASGGPVVRRHPLLKQGRPEG
jgi:hypothetical protein